MKNLGILLLTLLCPILIFSQQGINYQAVVRDGTGALMTNQNITVAFSIIKTSASGTTVYSENQNPLTDDNGLINVVIGDGTPSSGTFANIDWGADRHFLKIKINGTTMGTIEFQYVPYSLYAQSLTNIKTNTSVADLEMTSDDNHASVHIRPTATGNGDNSSIFFGEGSTADYGMAITYDGLANDLMISGSNLNGVIGTSLTINRDNSTATFTNGVEVGETTQTPSGNVVYGNSLPIAYGSIAGTTINTDFGITSVTNGSTGVFEIILDNNFVGAPVVIATSFNNSSDTEIITYNYSGTNTITVRVVDESNNAINSNFSIVVFGTIQ